MVIAVIDGQGGGVGSVIIKKLRERIPNNIKIIALGTNSIATAAMMRARANKGATGENAVLQMVKSVDIITGPMTIIMANSMMGELTPNMATAIADSKAIKILLPISVELLEIINVVSEPLPHLVDKLVTRIKEITHV